MDNARRTRGALSRHHFCKLRHSALRRLSSGWEIGATGRKSTYLGACRRKSAYSSHSSLVSWPREGAWSGSNRCCRPCPRRARGTRLAPPHRPPPAYVPPELPASAAVGDRKSVGSGKVVT